MYSCYHNNIPFSPFDIDIINQYGKAWDNMYKFNSIIDVPDKAFKRIPTPALCRTSAFHFNGEITFHIRLTTELCGAAHGWLFSMWQSFGK